MELGETFEETAKRETYEETGLIVEELQLFGLYSGESCFVTYPNGDQVYSVQVIFHSRNLFRRTATGWCRKQSTPFLWER